MLELSLLGGEWLALAVDDPLGMQAIERLGVAAMAFELYLNELVLLLKLLVLLEERMLVCIELVLLVLDFLHLLSRALLLGRGLEQMGGLALRGFI